MSRNNILKFILVANIFTIYRKDKLFDSFSVYSNPETHTRKTVGYPQSN